MIELTVERDANESLTVPGPTVIKIIGCGGGGSMAVNRMIEAGVSDVECIVMNTDLQALGVSKARKRLPIGQKLTGGLGAGGNPEVGENAAKEDEDLIRETISGANMVIITAGMGGGTGTGSAPVVAKISHELNVLTIAVVTTPFGFEGPVRMENAMTGLAKLRENVDSLIVIPNQQIMKIVGTDRKLSYKQSFRLADDVLCQGVMGITELITKPGEVNCDFADMTTVMKDKGEAILGVGIAEGENRAVEAAQKAISNPMLENRSIDGARYILVNITSDGDLAMVEVEEVIKTISASASKNFSLFWGQVLDPSMGGKVSVTVIATGFEKSNEELEREKAEERAENANGNVMPLDEFDRVLGGNQTGMKKNEPRPEIFSGRGMGSQLSSSDIFDDVAPPRHASNAQMTPPPRPQAQRPMMNTVGAGDYYEDDSDSLSDDVSEDMDSEPVEKAPVSLVGTYGSKVSGLRKNRQPYTPSESYDGDKFDLNTPTVVRESKKLTRTIKLTED